MAKSWKALFSQFSMHVLVTSCRSIIHIRIQFLPCLSSLLNQCKLLVATRRQNESEHAERKFSSFFEGIACDVAAGKIANECEENLFVALSLESCLHAQKISNLKITRGNFHFHINLGAQRTQKKRSAKGRDFTQVPDVAAYFNISFFTAAQRFWH
jgi:hypothetical protein